MLCLYVHRELSESWLVHILNWENESLSSLLVKKIIAAAVSHIISSKRYDSWAAGSPNIPHSTSPPFSARQFNKTDCPSQPPARMYRLLQWELCTNNALSNRWRCVWPFLSPVALAVSPELPTSGWRDEQLLKTSEFQTGTSCFPSFTLVQFLSG